MGKALRLYILLLFVGAVFLLTACAQDRYLSDFCLHSSPARPNSAAWEAADRQFREWIVAHNEKGMELCGWRP